MRSIYKLRSGSRRSEAPHRREHNTVVHPWLSLPDRLAATQAAMRELAGTAAFRCPLGDALASRSAPIAHEKKEAAGPGSVNVVVRKRRFASLVPPSAVAVPRQA